MKTNSTKKEKFNGLNLRKQLQGIPFKKLSIKSGFCKRKPRKIGAKNIIISFLLTVWGSKKNTYSNWASKLGMLINDTVSKQAVSKRVTEELISYLRTVLKVVMKRSIGLKKMDKKIEVLKDFKRVIIEDSTTIHLNEKLNEEYPGSSNHLNRNYATMKIQAAYEILTRSFIRFGITNYRENDQGYAGKIMEILKPGDLLLRDLGYFITAIFKKLNEKGISYISRLRKGVNIYEKDEEEPIDLAKMLRKRGNLDIKVSLGKEERTPSAANSDTYRSSSSF